MPKHIELETKLKNSKFSLYKLGDSFISSQIVDGPFGSDLKVNEYVESGIPLLRVSNCRDGIIKINDEMVFISLEKHLQLCRSEVLPNDVLLTKAGAILGYSAVFPFHLERGNITSHLVSIRPTQNIESRFLSDFLTSRLGNQQIYRWGNKSTRPELNTDEVKKILILVPPIAKQTELVAAMDEARSHRKQKLAEADALLDGSDTEILNILGLNIPTLSPRNIFATKLSDINQSGRIDVSYHLPFHQTINKVLNSCPYPLLSIGELCYKPVGGATPRKGDQELYTDSGIKFLRILNIKTNEIDLTDVKYIKPDVHEGQLKRSQLNCGDVLMTITGRVGTATVVSENILPANINQHIVRLTMLNDDCLPEYLAAYLNTTLGLTISNRSVTGGTRIALDYGAIQSIPIPLPPKEIQEQVIAVVQRRRSESQRLRSEAETGWQAAKQWFEDQLLGGS